MLNQEITLHQEEHDGLLYLSTLMLPLYYIFLGYLYFRYKKDKKREDFDRVFTPKIYFMILLMLLDRIGFLTVYLWENDYDYVTVTLIEFTSKEILYAILFSIICLKWFELSMVALMVPHFRVKYRMRKFMVGWGLLYTFMISVCILDAVVQLTTWNRYASLYLFLDILLLIVIIQFLIYGVKILKTTKVIQLNSPQTQKFKTFIVTSSLTLVARFTLNLSMMVCMIPKDKNRSLDKRIIKESFLGFLLFKLAQDVFFEILPIVYLLFYIEPIKKKNTMKESSSESNGLLVSLVQDIRNSKKVYPNFPSQGLADQDTKPSFQ